jgi:hypothetical protein
VRANLVCTGYRPLGELRIRNENPAARKAIARGQPQLLVSTVQPPIEELARSAFYFHYVRGFSTTYDVLDIIWRNSGEEQHLSASVDAVSLAFFNFQYDAAPAADRARTRYLQALPHLRGALNAPDQSATDSTLLATLFLDLFEKISSPEPVRAIAWASHVRGAMALMSLRDSTQMQTYLGLRLSRRLFTNMLITCIVADAQIPANLRCLHNELRPRVNDEDPKWAASTLALEYADLRGDIRCGSLPVAELLRKASQLDKDFEELAAHLPASWIAHRFSALENSSVALNRYFDVYPDYFTAQTCNVIRIMRILLNDWLRENKSVDMSGRHHVEPDFCTGDFEAGIIDTMSEQICASGPPLMTSDPKKNTYSAASRVQKLHCYTLLFPFYIAAAYASPSTRVKPWVIQRLDDIADNFGIRNARKLSEILRRNEILRPWNVYAMLGSYAFAA